MRSRAIAIAALLAATTALAEDEVAIGQQAVLMLKILKFDRSLEARAGEHAVVAVIYLENDPDSEADRVEVQTALDAARRNVSFPLPVKVMRLPYSPSTFEADLANLKPVAAYVCDGLASRIPAISRATRKQGTLTFADVESYIPSGLSIGLVLREDRAAILVNLPASKAEGADLSSDLLRLSEVIR